MPFFILIPIWLLCVVIGLAMLASRQLRFLASYVILGSTFGLLVSFVLSTTALLLFAWLAPRIGHHRLGAIGSLLGYIGLLGYIIGLVGGGFIGTAVGALMAYRLNLRVGLSGPNSAS